MELLESVVPRPRQARYQAALRPDARILARVAPGFTAAFMTRLVAKLGARPEVQGQGMPCLASTSQRCGSVKAEPFREQGRHTVHEAVCRKQSAIALSDQQPLTPGW